MSSTEEAGTSVDISGAREKQESELESLESTYGEKIFLRIKRHDQLGAIFTICTRLPNDSLELRWRPMQDGAGEAGSLQVNHLPPIDFEVLFPSSYPDVGKPKFIIKAHWLSMKDITKLCVRLDQIWELWETMPVVFAWVEFLEKEALEFLGYSEQIDLTPVIAFHSGFENLDEKKKRVQNLRGPQSGGGKGPFDARSMTTAVPIKNFIPFLKDYNEIKRAETFARTNIDCGICFSSRCGKNMTVFEPCGHYFCNDCTRQQIETQISEGLPNGHLTCMEPGCGSEFSTSEIERLIGKERFQRYDKLLLERCLSTMEDMKYCPRENCQQPAIYEKDTTVCICAHCNFSFCLLCLKTSHGINPCALDDKSRLDLIENYNSATAEQRQFLKKKYSEQYIMGLINEHNSNEWKRQNSKRCPKCNTDIQKSEGCNKMTCAKCQTKFCYLCGTSLNKLQNPYDHFNQARSPCHMKLFDLDDNDGDGDDGDDDDFLMEDILEDGAEGELDDLLAGQRIIELLYGIINDGER